MAGAPVGNNNSSRNNRLWTDTIRRIAVQSDGKRLRAIAEALYDKAEQGDIAAIKEIGDRLEGKPAQTITGDKDNPLTVLHKIEREIIDSLKD